MEPSPKAPGMEDFLEKMTGRSSAILNNRCLAPPLGCGQFVFVDGFRDEVSRREYTISGFCQTCQDKVFGDV